MSRRNEHGSRRVFLRVRFAFPRLSWRFVASLAALLAVVAVAWLLHLQVTLARGFEGGLWEIPSRVYSDTLELTAGQHFSSASLVRRLERSGYARVARAARPGQYSVSGAEVDVHRRSFPDRGTRVPSARARLSFRGDRVQAINDPAGRRLERFVLEPELLATLYGERQEERVPLRLEDVPQRLIHAVLAAEDARFFRHHGLDLRGILRAAWVNVRQGAIVQGGSTITQQTVKNMLLGEERTWTRKLREAPMAVLLDAGYDKERILEVYLNEVYLGQRGSVAVCGVQAAARFYFGRDVRDLSLGESALLAGMIRSPGRYNPFRHPGKAAERRDQVLEAMSRLSLAEPFEVDQAKQERLALASGSRGFSGAPFAVDLVRGRLAQAYPSRRLREEGLRIYTTIDTHWQEGAESALVDGLDRIGREVDVVAQQADRRTLEGAVVVIDPHTGGIVALVGGRDYSRSQYNRAVQARRQPGSCFKPLVFAAGFDDPVDKGLSLTPATLLDDSPLELMSGGERWRPANHDRAFRGWVSVRQALEQSLNVPTVRAARRIGLETVIDTSHRLGIRSPLRAVPSLALGSIEVTPLELAGAYATLAQSGRHTPPWIIREVADKDGKLLARREPEWRQAVSPETAYLVTDILQGVFRGGTARTAATLGYRGEAAGKTGTTDDTRDAWFVGYTRDVVALTWIGFDDNARTGLTGATGALPIWVDLMKRADTSAGSRRFDVPRGIVQRRIDPTTGGLMRSGCPEWIDEVFAHGTEPRRPCPVHGSRFRDWFRRFVGKRPYESGPGV